jgi:hypothetical protein
MIMNGCVAQQSPARLPSCRFSRSDGRSQERRQPASLSERTLDGGSSGGYLTHYSKSDTGELYSPVRASTKLYI